jgi:hypothetical protein
VAGYLFTGHARFIVTGDRNDGQKTGSMWQDTHPDMLSVRSLEWLAAIVFGVGALASFQVSLFGLAIAYALVAAMNSLTWGVSLLTKLVWLPFTLILSGMVLGGMSLLGLQPLFFGFGFHF